MATAFKLLARTLTFECRAEVEGFSPDHPAAPACLYCLWHDAVLIPVATCMHGNPSRRVAALVSRHQDGAYLADFMRHFGIESVRGSTRHGGSEAARTLIREGQQSHIYITPDGPRGPRREIKPGILFLAAQTGMPIVPVGTAGSAGWRVRGNWTDMYVPKPFSKVAHYLGSPTYVPHDIDRPGLLEMQRKLEQEMSRVEECANQVLTGENSTLVRWPKAA